MDMRKISVCITVYNRGRAEKLNMTLRTLAEQTRPPDEVIISDDCSPNDPTVVVERWRPYFPSLRFFRHSQNIGMPANLNFVISRAGGDYIANLHDADEFYPTLLEKWESVLDTYPSVGFVFCGIDGWYSKQHSNNGVIVHDVDEFTKGRDFFEKYFLHKYSSIVWGTVMARRRAYEELLPFDPGYSYISDVDMWMRMCLHWDVGYVKEPLIILDNTPTPWRQFRWDRIGLMYRIQIENINRFYADQPERLRRELNRHHWIVQKVYLRRLLGRAWHRDWDGLREGMKRCQELNWPIRILGELSNGV